MVTNVSAVLLILQGLNLHKVNGRILTMNDYVKEFILKTWGTKDRFGSYGTSDQGTHRSQI